MIEISNVYFKYLHSKEFILENFSLKISKGEFVGIIGPTGCGKSTICYLFNGLIPNMFKGLFRGSVVVAGLIPGEESVGRMSQVVGYLLQEPSFQIASPLVESEIAFGMENLGIVRAEMERRITEVMRKLDIAHLRNRATSSLSEGEKQSVVLASILTMEPEVLVLDEASSMLDTSSKKNLAKILKELNEKDGKTIVMIEHDLDFILPLAKRLILVNKGRIIAGGSTENVLTNSELLKENGLVPPSLISLFQALKENGLPVREMPVNYSRAEEILRSWLE